MSKPLHTLLRLCTGLLILRNLVQNICDLLILALEQDTVDLRFLADFRWPILLSVFLRIKFGFLRAALRIGLVVYCFIWQLSHFARAQSFPYCVSTKTGQLCRGARIDTDHTRPVRTTGSEEQLFNFTIHDPIYSTRWILREMVLSISTRHVTTFLGCKTIIFKSTYCEFSFAIGCKNGLD